MPEYDHDGVDDEKRALLEQKEREVDDARIHGVFFGILSGGYVWVVFNGLWSLVEELLRGFLPPSFAVGYTISIICGIGGLILHRGFTGENWFNEFHPGWKGRVVGLAWFTFVSTFIILLIWVITAGMPWWLTLPLILIGGSGVILSGLWAFKRLANRIGVNF